MKQLYYNHPEFNVLKLKDALQLIKDEIVEFIEEPSYDEFSDVMYAVNRTVGSVFNMKYIKLVPGDNMHIKKCNARFLEYNHFRSKRHLTP